MKIVIYKDKVNQTNPGVEMIYHQSIHPIKIALVVITILRVKPLKLVAIQIIMSQC